MRGQRTNSTLLRIPLRRGTIVASTEACLERRAAAGLPARVRWIIPRLFGALLLVAAALKAHGTGPAPVSAMGLLSAVWFQVGLIVAEGLLGLSLLSGFAPLGSWGVAVTTFAGFAAFSFYQGRCS